MSCRTTDGCNWLDRDLLCQDYKVLADSPLLRVIKGGDFAGTRGNCQCGFGKDWDQDDLKCQWSIVMIVVFTIFGLIGMVVLGKTLTWLCKNRKKCDCSCSNSDNVCVRVFSVLCCEC